MRLVFNSNLHACANLELRITSTWQRSPEPPNVHSFIYLMLLYRYLNDAAVVSFGKVSDDQKSQAQGSGVAIYSWEEFLNLVSKYLFWITEYNIVLHLALLECLT